MAETIVTVTKKGKATIPKKLRDKHKIGKRSSQLIPKRGCF